MDIKKDKESCSTHASKEGQCHDKVESLKPDHDVHGEGCGCGAKGEVKADKEKKS